MYWYSLEGRDYTQCFGSGILMGVYIDTRLFKIQYKCDNDIVFIRTLGKLEPKKICHKVYDR